MFFYKKTSIIHDIMSIVTLRNISIQFSEHALLQKANLAIQTGEKICLIGRNGEGKTTLLKIIAGMIKPDQGDIEKRQTIKIETLSQEIPIDLHGSVFDIVKSSSNAHDDHPIYAMLTRLSLDPNSEFSTLSGGLKRRVLFAKALVNQPDLLLLDEPTNHMDIESIEWLEKLLIQYKGALLFVTHDRTFLQNIATRIIELDRAQLTSWECDYNTYLERKAEALQAEEQSNKNFDKKLAQEEHWVRHGISARRKRNQGRVRKLQALRQIRQARRSTVGKAAITLQDTEQSGKIVIEAKNITFNYDEKPIIQNFSTTIMRGDKIGIIGGNGCGKTTLLRLLLGELSPQQGTIKQGTKLQIAHFDQLRAQLNEAQNARDNIGQGSDQITVNGVSKHIMSYLQDFLFSPTKALMPVKNLSGGEKNRLMLAKLFTKPTNVLVMDEPTNDLDIETLELLENLLVEYPGSLLLVSHDRTFLNNVVTSTIVFEKNGELNEYVGGYDDWQRQKPKTITQTKKQKTDQKELPKPKSNRLTYKEKLELEQLPHLIEQLETEQAKLHEELAQPDFYQQSSEKIIEIQTKEKENQLKLNQTYERWEILDKKDDTK